MKKLVSLILVFVLTLSVLVCAQASTISDNQTTRNAETSSAEAEKAQAEPYVVKVYDAASFTDKHSALTNKSGEHVESSAILTTHYLMSDGTWRVQKYDGSGMDDKVFNHRYILSSGNSFDFPLVVLTVNDTDMDWYYALIAGTGLSSDFDQSTEFRNEARVVALFFSDATVEFLDMQDQVPAHCMTIIHSETSK